MTRSILITGATGFLGTAIAAALNQRGERVFGISRQPQTSADGDAVTHWHQYGPDRQVPPEALDGVDAVIHLAGESVVGRWSAAKKERILNSRVMGTRAVVDALKSAGDKRPNVLISASAIGYYGDRGDEALNELSTSPPDDFLADVCRQWEAEAAAAESLGVRVVTLRIGLVMHPRGGALKAMLTPFRLGLGGRMGSGRQWQSWIHLDDLVGLTLFALDHEGMRGAVNGTAPNPETQQAFAKTLGKTIGRPTFMPAPAFALRAALGEFAVELLSSKKVLPEAAQAAGFSFQHPHLDSALADLLT